jgi:hypothetical protein
MQVTLKNKYGPELLLLAIYFITYAVFLRLTPSLHSLMSNYIPNLRSEYQVTEQLSKYYLFIMMLISMIGYTKSKNLLDIKISLGFLSLSIVMYLSESNMITSYAQPIFALLIVSNMLRYFIRAKNWTVMAFYCLGFGFISIGVLLDFIHEVAVIKNITPLILVDVLESIGEEIADTIGLLLLCISTSLCYRVFIFDLFKTHKTLIATLLLSSACITYGNSIIHWQYYPSDVIYLTSLFTTLIGLIGFILTNESLKRRNLQLSLVTPEGVYFTIALLCLILPATFGKTSSLSSLVIWLSVLSFYIHFLWQKHPARIKSSIQ